MGFGKEGKKPMLNDKNLEELFLQSLKAIEKTGLKQYQISNFSIEGQECIHNKMYWKSNKDFLGIGCGASGMINGLRIKNSTSLTQYMKEMENLEKTGKIEKCIFYKKTEGQMLEDYLIGSIMTITGIRQEDVDMIEKGKYEKIRDIFNKKIPFEYLQKIDEKSIVLSQLGLFRADNILVEIVNNL